MFTITLAAAAVPSKSIVIPSPLTEVEAEGWTLKSPTVAPIAAPPVPPLSVITHWAVISQAVSPAFNDPAAIAAGAAANTAPCSIQVNAGNWVVNNALPAAALAK